MPAQTSGPPPSSWTTRLTEALTESVEAAAELITNAPPVQSWLQAAAYETAMRLQNEADLAATASAYGELLDDFHARFPEIADAVRAATDACGKVKLDWNPLAPQYSRLAIDFDRDYDVHVFRALRLLEEPPARRALEAVRAALPPGEPFAGHPNVVNGIVAYEGHCLGLRAVAERIGSSTAQSFTLMAPGYEPARGLALHDAVRGTLRYFRSAVTPRAASGPPDPDAAPGNDDGV